MSAVKLSYFQFTVLAEPIRFILAYGGIEFIDERLSDDEFAAVKNNFPFGRVPVLEIDGLKLHQSLAICRYLAPKVGLAGNTPESFVLCDVMAETVNDVRAGIAKFRFDPHLSDSDRARHRDEALVQTRVYLDKLENILKTNDGYLALPGQLSWPDVMFASLVKNMDWMTETKLLKNHPGLTKLVDSVLNIPNIAKYIKNSPHTER